MGHSSLGADSNPKKDLETKIAELEAKLKKLEIKNEYWGAVIDELPTDDDRVNRLFEREYPKYIEKMNIFKKSLHVSKSKDTLSKGFEEKPVTNTKPKGALPKGFEEKPVKKTGGFKTKHLILGVIVASITFTLIVMGGTPSNNNETSNIVDMSIPSAPGFIPVEIQTNSLLDVGQCTESESCKTARAQMSAINDCNEMIDLWSKSEGWVLRPVLASQIVDRC